MKNFSVFVFYLILIIFGFLLTALISPSSSDDNVGNSSNIRREFGITIVILSQSNERHVKNAQKLKEQLEEQVKYKSVTIKLLHETWPEIGSWTIFPLFTKLIRSQAPKEWVFFSQEGTATDIKKLFNVLSRYDQKKDWFLGRGIRDREATIIHHFAFHDNPQAFLYPDFAAGFALNLPLIKKLESRRIAFVDKLDFSIDPQYELAKFIWNDGNGTVLTNVPEFCIEKDLTKCATYFTASKIPICNRPVLQSDIFFAIKTCTKFHGDRVPIILNTWGNSSNVKLFSDGSEQGPHYVDLGIPNTERGHCAKTIGILNYVAKDKALARKSWIVIADDDTLMSVQRLLRLLSCYSAAQPVAIGERYGFRTASQRGYDYITGGGGMVFSMNAVERLVNSGVCICPSADTPDDMFLGLCLKQLSIQITHNPNFHQARPDDYNSEILKHQEPISFHKFWLIDPYETYDKWLKDASEHVKNVQKDEL